MLNVITVLGFVASFICIFREIYIQGPPKWKRRPGAQESPGAAVHNRWGLSLQQEPSPRPGAESCAGLSRRGQAAGAYAWPQLTPLSFLLISLSRDPELRSMMAGPQRPQALTVYVLVSHRWRHRKHVSRPASGQGHSHSQRPGRSPTPTPSVPAHSLPLGIYCIGPTIFRQWVTEQKALWIG